MSKSNFVGHEKWLQKGKIIETRLIGADLDRLWTMRLSLRHSQAEDAVLQAGFRLGGVKRSRQGDHTAESTYRQFACKEFVVLFIGSLKLASDGNGVVQHFNVNVIRLDSRDQSLS